jgi:hypothetical protein
MFNRYHTTLIISLLFAQITFAQTTKDSILELDEVNIIQNYEPILINSEKVPLSPDIPKINKTKADEQTYNFADVKGKIKYLAEDIKPIKVAIKPNEKQKFFYAKAGFGNYLTPLLNLSIVNPNQAKYRAGLNADFIYSKAKKPRFQEYFDLKAKGFGEYFIKNSALVGASATFQFDKYHFYGNTDTLLEKNDVKNMYKRFGADIYLKNIADKDYDYSANVGFQNTSNTLKQKETTIDIKAKGSYMFMQNIGAGANFWANNIAYKDDTSKNNRFSIAVNPYAIVQYKIWKLQAGANMMITNNKFYVLPSFLNTLKIYKNYLVMYNEWNSNVKINSLHQTSLENAFIYDNNFKNQINEKRTFIGLRGAFSGFYYNVSFSQLVNRNHLQFIDNTYDTTTINYPPNATFQADYVHRLKAWNPSFSLGFQKGNQFGANVTLDYFIYKNTTSELSYQPNLKADFTAFYNWKNKLHVNLNLIAYGKMNATRQTIESGLITNRISEQIKGVVDLNLSATYFFTKNIGAFIDLNNLAFQKYQHFINYPTYSFQAIGGIKISY